MDKNNCNNEDTTDMNAGSPRGQEGTDSNLGIELKLSELKVENTDSGSDGDDDSILSPPVSQRTERSFGSDVEGSGSGTTICSDCSTEPISQFSDTSDEYEPTWCSQDGQDSDPETETELDNSPDSFVPFSEGDITTDATMYGISPSGSCVFQDDDSEVTFVDDSEMTYVAEEPEVTYVAEEPEVTYEAEEPEVTYAAEEPEVTYVAEESCIESNVTEEVTKIEDPAPSYEDNSLTCEDLEDDNIVVICHRDQHEYNTYVTVAMPPVIQDPVENVPAYNSAPVPVQSEGYIQPYCQENIPTQYQESSEGYENKENFDPVQQVSTSWVDLAAMTPQDQMAAMPGTGDNTTLEGSIPPPPPYSQQIPPHAMTGGEYEMNPGQCQSYQYMPYTPEGNQVQQYASNESLQPPYIPHTTGGEGGSDPYMTNGIPNGAVNYYYVPDGNQQYQPVYVQYGYPQPPPPDQGEEKDEQQTQEENTCTKYFTGSHEVEYPVPIQSEVVNNLKKVPSEKRYKLICEQEPNFPDLGPDAEQLSYPYIYVSSAGLLTVLLRGNLAVELTLDHTIRLVNHERGSVAATNADGSSSCVLQRGVRVFQDRTVTEAAFYKRRRAYMTTAESFFAVGDLCYRLGGKDLYKTETEFSDLSNDLSVNILYSSRSYGPALIPNYMNCAQAAQYTNHRNGGISVFINGIRIYQSPRYDVEVSQGEKFIRMSPRFGSVFVGTQWVEIALEKRGTVRVRRGGHYIYASQEDFSITADNIECGLDRTLHAFIRPVEVKTYPLNPNRFLNDPSIPKFRRRLRRNKRKPKNKSEESLNSTTSELDTTFEDTESQHQEEHDQSIESAYSREETEGEGLYYDGTYTSNEESKYTDTTYSNDSLYKLCEECKLEQAEDWETENTFPTDCLDGGARVYDGAPSQEETN